MSIPRRTRRNTPVTLRHTLLVGCAIAGIAVVLAIVLGNLLNGYFGDQFQKDQSNRLAEAGFSHVRVHYGSGFTHPTAVVNVTPKCVSTLTRLSLGDTEARWMALPTASHKDATYFVTTAQELAKQPGVCNH